MKEKHSGAGIGKEGELIVQKKLWQRNFRVKNVALFTNHGLHFDLLVNDKIRVEVKTVVKLPVKSNHYIDIRLNEFDILAVVILDPFYSKVFFANKEMLKKCKVKSMIEKGDNFNTISVNEKILKEIFISNPASILV